MMTPTSLPGGPVTVLGGQRALKPSIWVVAEYEWVVSVSERMATEALCLIMRRRACSDLPWHIIPLTLTAKKLRFELIKREPDFEPEPYRPVPIGLVSLGLAP